MKIATQVIAFTGMVFVGGVLLSTAHAASFGQQWRPASGGYTTAHNGGASYQRGFRRVANVPAFRPRSSASSPRYVARTVYRPAAYQRPVRLQQPVIPQVARVPPPQPMHGMAYPGMSPWSAMPAWANPFAHMSRAWQYPMPAYSRQFAWQPNDRARVSQNSRSADRYRRYASYDAASSPRLGYRPAARTSFVAAPTWRPAGNVRTTYRNHGARTLASYRPTTGYAAPRVAANVVPLRPAPASVWRPRGPAVASVHAADSAFRPTAYGRSQSALTASTSPRVAAERLPGWVTTYQDGVGGSACDWCSGS